MPRYVVLAHHTTPFHYDLMLEHGEVLATWSFDEPPGQDVQACRLIQDHRKIYLEYEGEISGGRGRVERWDAGTYDGEIAEEAARATFSGGKLAGTWRLEKVDETDGWVMRSEPPSPSSGIEG